MVGSNMSMESFIYAMSFSVGNEVSQILSNQINQVNTINFYKNFISASKLACNGAYSHELK